MEVQENKIRLKMEWQWKVTLSSVQEKISTSQRRFDTSIQIAHCNRYSVTVKS